MTHDHHPPGPSVVGDARNDDERRWDAIRSTDDPRQRAAALGADFDRLARAARVLTGVLAIVVTVVVLAATVATVAWGLDVPQVLLGAIIGMLSALAQVFIVLIGVRLRPGSMVITALTAAVASMAQMSIVAAVIVATGADRSLVVGLVCGSISIAFSQWAGPPAAVKEIRRPTPRPTIVSFADAPHWSWAPDGKLALTVTIGLLGIAGAMVETIALVVALPSFVLLLLLTAVLSVSMNRAIASPRRIILLQLLSIIIFGTIAAIAIGIDSLAASA